MRFQVRKEKGLLTGSRSPFGRCCVAHLYDSNAVERKIFINNKTNNHGKLGQKILAAFVEVTDEEPTTVAKQLSKTAFHISRYCSNASKPQANNTTTEKFKQYFDQLFKDTNLPGPDYFEFCKMTESNAGDTG